VGSVFVWLAITTFGIPLLLGLSWSPHPITPFTPSERAPRWLAAMDNFSFPHLDWPSRVLEATQLRQGRLPLWNSYSSLGVPLAGQYQNQVFFPLEWIEMFAGPTLWTLFLMGKMIMAAIGSYLVMRRLVGDDLAALIGAIAYQFSAYFVWLYTVPAFVNGAFLVPWLFFGILKLSDERSSTLQACGLTSIVVGLMFLAGQPQIAFLSVAGGLLYLVALAVMSKSVKGGVRSVGAFVLSAALGLGIAGVQLRLFWEAVEHGYTLHSPGAYERAGTLVLNFTTPMWPFLMGQLMSPWDVRVFPDRLNWEGFPLLLGAFGLFLLSLGLVRCLSSALRPIERPESAMAAMFVLVAIIIMIVVSGTTGIASLWSRPEVSRVNFPRYVSPLLSFAISAVVAWTLTGVRTTRRWELVAVNGIIFVASLAALRLVLPHLFNVPAQVDRTYMIASIWLTALPFIVVLGCMNVVLVAFIRGRIGASRAQVALLFCLLAEVTFFVRYGLGLEDEMLRLWVLAGYAAASILVVLRMERFLLGGIPALALCAGLIVGFAPHRLSPIWDPFANPPRYIQFLKERLGESSTNGRVLGAQAVMIPNVATGFGIGELASLTPVQVETTARYIFEALVDKPLRYTVPVAWPGVEAGPSYPSWTDYLARRKYYNFIGVKYLVDAPTGALNELAAEGIETVYQEGTVHIYADRRAFPRAFALNAVEAVRDVKTARKAILAPDFNFRERLVVEQGTQLLPEWLVRPWAPRFIPLPIARYSDSVVELETDLDAPAMVVLTDSFYPGWVAYVDGKRRPLYRVNSIVRGVPVEAGSHRVSFRYEPPYLRGWVLVSLGNAVISLFLLTLSGSGGAIVRWMPKLAPRPMAVAGGLLIWLLVEVGTMVYLDEDVRSKLRSLLPVTVAEETLADSKGLRAIYVPPRREITLGTEIDTADLVLAEGDVVLSGSSGQLLRLEKYGGMVRLVGQKGQKILVSNVGMWESTSRAFTGFEAVYDNGRWVVDASPMRPVNPNSNFQIDSEKEPIPGFWVSSGVAGYTITHMRDESGPFVRVQATQPQPYLSINGQDALTTLHGVPASVRGQVRAHSKSRPRLTLHDVVAGDGTTEDYSTRSRSAGEWTTLIVRAEKIRYPSSSDRFSLGLTKVSAGDWFDVRELSLFVGILP
ncbi:MAG TPA: YfhO family protein, partial [Methylomirabilota bacterium]|nr:YfhO family protein [Methylomirabilota bacterium]